MLLDAETDDEVTYTLVGEDESDIGSGRLSISSPIARALLGKRVDDVVQGRGAEGDPGVRDPRHPLRLSSFRRSAVPVR